LDSFINILFSFFFPFCGAFSISVSFSFCDTFFASNSFSFCVTFSSSSSLLSFLFIMSFLDLDSIRDAPSF
jgi:hypothetical protein